jgi:hypothetical protein
MPRQTLKRCIGYAAIVFLPLLHASAQTTIFTDNFASGPSPLWSNLRGDWVATNGGYFAALPNNNPVTYSAVPFTLADFTLFVDINNVGDGGLWLHADPPGENGILLVTGGNGYGSGSRGGNAGSSLYWHQVINNTFSAALNEVYNVFTNPGAENVRIEVQVSGNVYSAFVNGSATPATSLTNSVFSSGWAGLYDFSSQTFSDFALQVPSRGQGPFALAVTNSGPLQATISWTTNANGFILESTPALPSPAWTPATNVSAITNAQFAVPIALTNTLGFFRLSAQ